MRDFRTENPKLHELYTGWAMHHLIALNKCIKRLQKFSNGNLLDAIRSLNDARANLLENDAAYQEAAWKLLAGHPLPPYHEAPDGNP